MRDLQSVLAILRAHREELVGLGVVHAAVFGSVARGEAGPESDVDVLIDLDPAKGLNLFEYCRVKLQISEMLGGSADVLHRKTLKPWLRENVMRDCFEAIQDSGSAFAWSCRVEVIWGDERICVRQPSDCATDIRVLRAAGRAVARRGVLGGYLPFGLSAF